MKWLWLLALIVTSACASVQHNPLYDGPVIADAAVSTTLVRLTVENLRTIDATPPRLLLIGSGSHDLGTIQGIDGKIDRLVDTSWFGPDGCFTLIAHFVGGPDLVFSAVCWRRGEVVDATLLNTFDPNTAWSHR